MSDQSIQIKFRTIAVQFFGIIKLMVDKARKAGVSKYRTEDVETIIKVLERYDPDSLIKAFLGTHSDWNVVKTKNIETVLEVAPRIFSMIPHVNPDVLIEPMRLFHNKAEHLKTLKMEDANFPITEGNIDSYWRYLDTLIAGATKYNEGLGDSKIIMGK